MIAADLLGYLQTHCRGRANTMTARENTANAKKA